MDDGDDFDRLLRDPVRLTGEMPPGEAQHAPAGAGERDVAGLILLERTPGSVRGVAVRLDDHAVRAPQEVHLLAGPDAR